MIRKLAALAGGWLQDPYVCCTLGSLLLLRGLDTIAAQAKQLGEQLTQVQTQHAAMAAWATTPHEHFRAQPHPGPADVDVDHQAPVDVAGEHEDLHP